MKKALVLSLAVVLGLGVASFAQTLSGSWDTDITITPTPVALALSSTLTVTYTVGDWSFTSVTGVDETGWQSQEFDVAWKLGVFSGSSTLTFDPIDVEFDEWEVVGSLTLAGVSFTGTFDLTPGVTTLELVGEGTAGAVGVTVTLDLGTDPGCNFDFNGVSIAVEFPFCECAAVTGTISFNCDGFEDVVFAVSGIAIPALPWVTLDAELTFQTGSKTLVLSPNFDFGPFVCFDLFIHQETGGTPPELTLGDIVIDGISISCTMAGVEFYGVSYWGEQPEDPTNPATPSETPELFVNGKWYWEMYKISTTDAGCCGPFNFSIALYFDTDSDQLFDVSLIDASMDIQLATQFTFNMGILLDLDAAPTTFTEWTLGFLVTWGD